MKKLFMYMIIIFLFMVFPYNVYASIYDNRVYVTQYNMTEIDTNFTKTGNNISYVYGTDFRTIYQNSDADFVAFQFLLNAYYSREKTYSNSGTSVMDFSGTIGALSVVQPSGSTTGNQVKCTEISNFPTSGTANHYSSCNVGLSANNLAGTITYTNYSGDFEFQQVNDNFAVKVRYADNSERTCDIDNGFILCPYPGNKIFVEIDIYNNNTNSYLLYNWQLTGNYIYLKSVYHQNEQQNQIINNTDTSSNSSDFDNTINNFDVPNTSHGFDILGSLQSFISGINVSGSCSRISVPIPFTNQNLVLPCMTTDVYSVHFPEIVVIWQLLVRGIGYYYILVNILRLIKETIDPFNFKLEVMDL